MVKLKKTGGRNHFGRVTARHQGGGHKQKYRIIDFRRDKRGIPAKVATIEYDPYRSARIALLHYTDGEKRYILAPVDMKVGDVILSGPDADIKPGNSLPLRAIPLGTIIHNIELKIGKGAQLARSAGTFAQLMSKEGKYSQVKLPSGQVGNTDHENVSLGKAGRSRWLGKRPKVRGVAMNPVDHPHGGGEGRTSGGRHPVTPWGIPTKGYKTRTNKTSDRFIVKKRTK